MFVHISKSKIATSTYIKKYIYLKNQNLHHIIHSLLVRVSQSTSPNNTSNIPCDVVRTSYTHRYHHPPFFTDSLFSFALTLVFVPIPASDALGSFSGWQHSIFRNFANLSMDVARLPACLHFTPASSIFYTTQLPSPLPQHLRPDLSNALPPSSSPFFTAYSSFSPSLSLGNLF